MFHESKKCVYFDSREVLLEELTKKELQQRTQKHLEEAQWILTAFESIYQSHGCSHFNAGGTIINIEQSNPICIQSISIQGKSTAKKKASLQSQTYWLLLLLRLIEIECWMAHKDLQGIYIIAINTEQEAHSGMRLYYLTESIIFDITGTQSLSVVFIWSD